VRVHELTVTYGIGQRVVRRRGRGIAGTMERCSHALFDGVRLLGECRANL
jgi:hypothetical protein